MSPPTPRLRSPGPGRLAALLLLLALPSLPACGERGRSGKRKLAVNAKGEYTPRQDRPCDPSCRTVADCTYEPYPYGSCCRARCRPVATSKACATRRQEEYESHCEPFWEGKEYKDVCPLLDCARPPPEKLACVAGRCSLVPIQEVPK